MKIRDLKIQNVRNLASTIAEFSSNLNVFTGDNGSGKTSILEAIYLGLLGKSFRTNSVSRYIKFNAEKTNVYIEIEDENNNLIDKIGFEKKRSGETLIFLNGQRLSSNIEIVKKLPILILSPEIETIFEGGPTERRKCIDWLMFHMKPNFYVEWRKFQQVLNERNALLKQSYVDPVSLKAWNNEFIKSAEIIHTYRYEILSEWIPYLLRYIQQNTEFSNVFIEYSPGWKCEIPLEQQLKERYPQDKIRGFTSLGPHRADLEIFVEENTAHKKIAAEQYLSRGEQKLLHATFKLCQAEYISTEYDKNVVFLYDDFAAELDSTHQKWILNRLWALRSQVFITTPAPSQTIKEIISQFQNVKLFHVKQGQLLVEND
ncbi:MAG: DNA replication/repair protein RecF [Pseudomonadota bacterium]